MFGTPDDPSDLAQKVMRQRGTAILDASAVDTADVTSGVARVMLTDDERKNVHVMIKEAKTLDEISRLEKLLTEGRVPGQ